MARNINLAVDCAECCDCPAPILQWDSRSASLTKQGYSPWDGSTSARYLTNTIGGSSSRNQGCPPTSNISEIIYSGAATYNYDGTCASSTAKRDFYIGGVYNSTVTYTCGVEAQPQISPPGNPTTTLDATRKYWVRNWCRSLPVGDEYFYDTVTNDLSDEYTTAQLLINTIAALGSFPGTWTGTPGSMRAVSSDELSAAVRDNRYRYPFKIPRVGTGLCYRTEWVERFIPETGVGLSSIEVFSRGVYRPMVTATGGGGSGCLLVAIMSSTGTVAGVRVLNPGSGYTSAPTITVQSAINGGTTSTGWTASLTTGRVTSVAGGSAGNYRPTLTIAAPGGGGTTATATVTLDATGGIDAATVTLAGTLYVATPALTITPRVPGSVAASLGLHLGTETSRCMEWDGITPGGYDPEDPATYPILGDGTNPYFELAVPAADGLTTVDLVRAFCDCSDCP